MLESTTYQGRITQGHPDYQRKQPIVYAIKRGEQVLYVGASRQGLRRALSWARPKQPWFPKRKWGDVLIVYWIPPELADYLPELETLFIEELKPIANKRWLGHHGRTPKEPLPLTPELLAEFRARMHGL
jgi:hypothetical protein